MNVEEQVEGELEHFDEGFRVVAEVKTRHYLADSGDADELENTEELENSDFVAEKESNIRKRDTR